MSDARPMREWGAVTDEELARVAVISPHLDDAVLGCGHLLARWGGATVLTVFTGAPDAYPDPQRPWDRECGFAPEDDVMEARRREDTAALAVLDAEPVHLGFVEYSYRPGDRVVEPEVIAPALAGALAACAPTAVFVPFGLANPDHDTTHRAALLAREGMARDDSGERPAWFLYEDYGYKHIPGMLAWRIAQLFRARLWPTPAHPEVDPSPGRKAAAMACYPSQLAALEDDWALAAKLAAPAPEQYWRLAPPPPGWEGLAD